MFELFLLFWVDRIDWAGTIFNNTMILMGLEILLYSRVSREYAQRIAQSEQLILQYRYNALRAQVNPHFLFNSLNTLYSMISSGNRNAENFVIELTKVYRYVLTQQNRETVEFQDEFFFLKSYVAILKTRYNNNFEMLVLGNEAEAASKKLIPYTLQLLIENVSKHNTISSKRPMNVILSIRPESISISNPIFPKTTSFSSGFGLSYLKEIYASFNTAFDTKNDGKTFTAIVHFIDT